MSARKLGASLAVAAVLAVSTAANAASVIPAPQSLTYVHGHFTVSAARTVYTGSASDVQRIGEYFSALLRDSGGPPLAVRPGEGAGGITFRLDPQGDPARESYRIEVTPSQVTVSARTADGLFYGAVSLWQLCTPAGAQSVRLPALMLKDAPRLRWRGLMLDSARHFQPPEFILRYLDWMALHKLNVFSWHLTDDQAWRLEIKKYPRLTAVGAWRVPAGRAAQLDIDPATGSPRLYGGFYSQEDVRRIVARAAERHITIVPEIDLPGHSTAAIVAYPQLGVRDAAPTPPAVPSDWGIYPNLVNVEEPTFAFLEAVLDELMALFPGPYVNLGGDEAVKDQWRASAATQARMRDLKVPNEAALQGYFTARLGKYLNEHGRRLVGWDEILEGGVPEDAVVISWRGADGAIHAASAGHDTVLAPDPSLYFDNRQGGGPGEPPGRGRVLSVEDVYRFEALPGALAGDHAHLLGIQANLWTEHVRTEERVAYMTYPRAAALAEVAWSSDAVRSWPHFRTRLKEQLARYQRLGITYSADAFAPARHVAPGARHMSQDLKTCSDQLVLNLEDDAPLEGPRAIFLIDVMDPCWIFPKVDLGRGGSLLTVAVGQVPFNFQLGHDVESIHLNPPASAAGELEVRLDGCSAAAVAVLPLAPATGNDTVTRLPSVHLPGRSGRHDLCFRFTQARLDLMWALDWVQVAR